MYKIFTGVSDMAIGDYIAATAVLLTLLFFAYAFVSNVLRKRKSVREQRHSPHAPSNGYSAIAKIQNGGLGDQEGGNV